MTSQDTAAEARVGSGPLFRVSGLEVVVPTRTRKQGKDADDSRARLLSHVDFSVAQGESIAFIGPSGVGKTTLLRTLAGLVDAAAGVIALHGQDIALMAPTAYRRRVHYVHQQSILAQPTIEECLARPFAFAASKAVGKHFDVEHAEHLLAELGLSGVLEKNPRTLSVGERQRVVMVRALLIGAELLLLDEPTSALDEALAQKLLSLLSERAPSRIAILHDRRLAERHFDRVVDVAIWSQEKARDHG